MEYQIELLWNGTTVLNGRCTAVVGYDICMAHLCEQFAGSEHKEFVASLKSGRHLEAIIRGERFNNHWSDSTGDARARLYKVEAETL